MLLLGERLGTDGLLRGQLKYSNTNIKATRQAVTVGKRKGTQAETHHSAQRTWGLAWLQSGVCGGKRG